MDISSSHRLELGGQGEVLGFSLMCSEKLQKDLEQGNDSPLISTDSSGSRYKWIVGGEKGRDTLRWPLPGSRAPGRGLGGRGRARHGRKWQT